MYITLKIKNIIKKTISTMNEREIIPIPHLIDTEQMLQGKVAIVTGGSGGIGYAIAKSFIESGCKIIITGTNEDKLNQCCKDLGSNANYITLNLNAVGSFGGKVIEAVKMFGKIDILVNSAGIFSTKNDFLHVEEDEYDDIMDINLKGTYFFCQAVAKYMVLTKIKGHILLISSQSALEPAWSPYRLSKCGVKGVTLGIAQQLLPYGIIVNAIAPGPTATMMQGYKKNESIYTDGNPAGRYAMPGEIAIYAKYLVSNLGDMIIGDTLYISGGRGIIDIN